MNAQTVVDTFAPFVGTEGLRGVTSVHTAIMDDRVIVALGETGPLRMIEPDIAHGFLLSRLAEGLVLRGAMPTRALANHRGKFFCVGCPDDEDYFPDYPSAILAAARVEWPKREPELVAVGGAEKRVLETLLAIRDDFDRRIKALGLDQTHPMMRADSD